MLNKTFIYKLLLTIVLLIIVFTTNQAFGDTIDIAVGSNKDISTINGSDNIINLNLNSNLKVDSDSSQDSVSGVFNGYGNIIFSSALCSIPSIAMMKAMKSILM